MVEDTKYVRGAQKLSKRIATIRASIQLPLLVDDITALLLSRTLRRFDREVDPNEKPWAPLQPQSIARKRRAGYGDRKLLVQTGNLRSAIKAIRGGTGTISTNTGAGSRIGIEDPKVVKYARLHNQGRGGMPLRKFLGIGADDVKAVDGLMRRKGLQLSRI